jgi:hypothetical protein
MIVDVAASDWTTCCSQNSKGAVSASGNPHTREPGGPLSLPEHGEATDRIPERTAHEDIRQEMNIEREP